jgi:3-deoxy-D-manno-octulosonic-acid transferase
VKISSLGIGHPSTSSLDKRFDKLTVLRTVLSNVEGLGTSLGAGRAEGTPYHKGTGQVEQVFILDTIGELKTMYAAADVVFVGGSLVKKGGQNPIEPASLAKPIIIGRFTFNFHDVTRAFLDNDAAIKVESRDELYETLRFLLDNPKERKRLGVNAKDTVTKNSGSSQRTVELIMSRIGKAA